MNLYHLESDPHMYINLDCSIENLKEHQVRLQKQMASLTMDLSVVTDAVVTSGQLKEL